MMTGPGYNRTRAFTWTAREQGPARFCHSRAVRLFSTPETRRFEAVCRLRQAAAVILEGPVGDRLMGPSSLDLFSRPFHVTGAPTDRDLTAPGRPRWTAGAVLCSTLALRQSRLLAGSKGRGGVVSDCACPRAADAPRSIRGRGLAFEPCVFRQIEVPGAEARRAD